MGSVASCTESDGNSLLGKRTLLCKEDGGGRRLDPSGREDP